MTDPISQRFSPSLLNDYKGLKQYLHGAKDLHEIWERANNKSQPSSKSSWGAKRLWWICTKSAIPALAFPFAALALGKKLQLDLDSPLGRWMMPCALATTAYGVSILGISIFMPLLGLSSSKNLLDTIGLRHLGSFCNVASDHMSEQYSEWFHLWWSKENPPLIPAMNTSKIEAFDVYMCPDIPANQITDRRIRLRTQVEYPISSSSIDFLQYKLHLRILVICFHKGYVLQIPFILLRAAISFAKGICRLILEENWGYITPHRDLRQICDRLKKTYSWALKEEPFIRFYGIFESLHTHYAMPDLVRIYNGDGVCRGAAEYFIHLCIQSRKWFDTPEKWLKAVAGQFRDGVPGQGAVMQALFDIPSNFFGYSVATLNTHKISSAELDARSEAAIDKIKTLPSGIYFTRVYKHGLVYIKLDNGVSYAWDSQTGLLKQTAEQLIDYVIGRYHKAGEENSGILFKRYRTFQWLPFSLFNRSIT